MLCAPILTPHGLLDALLNIETRMGRSRARESGEGGRFGPRIIDLDILLFGDLSLKDERLELPHPRVKKRAFVLVPLVEVAPDLILPDGESAAAALERLTYRLEGQYIYQS